MNVITLSNMKNYLQTKNIKIIYKPNIKNYFQTKEHIAH